MRSSKGELIPATGHEAFQVFTVPMELKPGKSGEDGESRPTSIDRML